VAAQVPDPTVGQVADELRFYLSYLDLLAPAEAAGLPTCLPEVSSDTKQLHAADTWDLPLGLDLVADERPVVTNDLELGGEERVLVVSGPNQGGKTTTARTFGQLHHLAALGCPVPGRAVRILLADQVLTVFEREETATDLGGRLGGELTRVHRVLDRLTPRSVVVLNEVFSSTAAQDARFLGRRVLERLIEADVPTVLVTFIDELSRLGPRTVSMVGLVDPADPTVRTLKVVRRRADGRAYADALAARYGLGHDDLVGRLAR
jgi:DNA mismatch repair ATPase MutS